MAIELMTVLLIAGWAILVVVSLCYLLTLLPALPAVLFTYLDKKVKERVDLRVNELLAQREGEIRALEQQKQKEEVVIRSIKEAVMNRMPRSELPPLGPGGR